MEPRTTNVRSPLSLGLSHHQHQPQQLMGQTAGLGNNSLDYLGGTGNNGGRTGNALDSTGLQRNSSNDLRLTSPGPSNDILSNNNNNASNEHILASTSGGQTQHHQSQQG